MNKTESFPQEYRGYRIEYKDTVDSTNTYLLSHPLADKTVLIAGQQTAGKGRRGKEWAGAPVGQALYISVLFHSMKVADIGFLPLLCGVAAARTMGAGAGVKWPNDIVLGGKKLCGILCESKLAGERAQVVCGFGFNLNQPAAFFAQNHLEHATSLFAHTGQSASWQDTALALIAHLDQLVAGYKTGTGEDILQEYTARCVNIGRKVQVLKDGGNTLATAVAVSSDGSLICKKDGETFAVYAGEASVRGVYGYY